MWSKIERIISMSTIAARTPNASLSLLTDLYQLSMASAYWESGTADKLAAFHLSFRKPPFDSGFTIACGLASANRIPPRLAV
jgi:nicotinic acid phosphoribosyltransferase